MSLLFVALAAVAISDYSEYADLLRTFKEEYEKNDTVSEATLDELRDAVEESPKEVRLCMWGCMLVFQCITFLLLRRILKFSCFIFHPLKSTSCVPESRSIYSPRLVMP